MSGGRGAGALGLVGVGVGAIVFTLSAGFRSRCIRCGNRRCGLDYPTVFNTVSREIARNIQQQHRPEPPSLSSSFPAAVPCLQLLAFVKRQRRRHPCASGSCQFPRLRASSPVQIAFVHAARRVRA